MDCPAYLLQSAVHGGVRVPCVPEPPSHQTLLSKPTYKKVGVSAGVDRCSAGLCGDPGGGSAQRDTIRLSDGPALGLQAHDSADKSVTGLCMAQ